MSRTIFKLRVVILHAETGTFLSRPNVFQQRAELLDQARQYRRLNAELDQTDRNSEWLSKFYIDECHALQEEIDALANEED